MDIINVLDRHLRNKKQLPGLACVLETDPSADQGLRGNPAGTMVQAFIGPWGSQLQQGVAPGMDWAMRLPAETSPLTSWSWYSGKDGGCLIEGEFYSEAWGRRPVRGYDEHLAREVFEQVKHNGIFAINELNGVFGGVVWSSRNREAYVFTDRLGIRRMFYRKVGSRLEIANCLHGFRASGNNGVKPDWHAISQLLTLRYPLSGRTVLADISKVLSGEAVVADRHGFRTTRYHRLPVRLRRAKPGEVAESISQALEHHARGVDVHNPEMLLSLSGGQDSRVVLSGMLAAGLSFHCIIFSSGIDDCDTWIAEQIARDMGLKFTSVRLEDKTLSDSTTVAKVSLLDALMSDGHCAGYGFPATAAVGAELGNVMFGGYGGNSLTGAWWDIAPWGLRSPQEVALAAWRTKQGPSLPSDQAARFLPKGQGMSEDELLQEWIDSFVRDHEPGPDMCATYLRNRLKNLDRRYAPVFEAMRPYIIPVYPFADLRVLEAYNTMPNSYLVGRKGHILASMYRYPQLGKHPSAQVNFLPHKWEYHLYHVFNVIRRLRRLRTRIRGTVSPPHGVHYELTNRDHALLEAIRTADLFDSEMLENYVRQIPRLGPDWLHRLAAVAVHTACSLGTKADVFAALCMK